MVLYFGWIVAAFLGGFLLALVLGGGQKRHPLRENFSEVETFRGMSYQEVLAIADAKPNTIVHQTDGTTQMVWREKGYAITLAFDAREVCLGVIDEQKE